MANRTESVRGVWAEDALTTIPPTPVTGIPYRDIALLTAAIKEGWPYKTIVDSSALNQALFEIYTLVKEIEDRGGLRYSEETDYVANSRCIRDDGNVMRAIVANGPSTTLRDPNVESNVPAYWIYSNADKFMEPIDRTGGPYTVLMSDSGDKGIVINDVVTIPTGLTVGSQFLLYNTNAVAQVLTTTGVTIEGGALGSLSGDGGLITLWVRATDVVVIKGDTE